LVVKKGSVYSVGYRDGRVKKYYCDMGVTANSSTYLPKAKELLRPYSTSRRVKQVFHKELSILDSMHEGKSSIDKNTVCAYYEAAYTLVMQEPSRKLTGKERGQLQALIRTYSKDLSLIPAMIAEFFANFDTYAQRIVPNPGLLLHNKDKLYAIVSGTSKRGVQYDPKDRLDDTF